jgi:hypothetical protein
VIRRRRSSRLLTPLASYLLTIRRIARHTTIAQRIPRPNWSNTPPTGAPDSALRPRNESVETTQALAIAAPTPQPRANPPRAATYSMKPLPVLPDMMLQPSATDRSIHGTALIRAGRRGHTRCTCGPVPGIRSGRSPWAGPLVPSRRMDATRVWVSGLCQRNDRRQCATAIPTRADHRRHRIAKLTELHDLGIDATRTASRGHTCEPQVAPPS